MASHRVGQAWPHGQPGPLTRRGVACLAVSGERATAGPEPPGSLPRSTRSPLAGPGPQGSWRLEAKPAPEQPRTDSPPLGAVQQGREEWRMLQLTGKEHQVLPPKQLCARLATAGRAGPRSLSKSTRSFAVIFKEFGPEHQVRASEATLLSRDPDD